MLKYEFYKDKIKSKNPLDAYYKDSMQDREAVFFAYDILSRTKPEASCVHRWNAARSAMSSVMGAYEKAFWDFMKNKTEENARKFSEMEERMIDPVKKARGAIFSNECQRNWQTSKSKYDKWRNGEEADDGR